MIKKKTNLIYKQFTFPPRCSKWQEKNLTIFLPITVILFQMENKKLLPFPPKEANLSFSLAQQLPYKNIVCLATATGNLRFFFFFFVRAFLSKYYSSVMISIINLSILSQEEKIASFPFSLLLECEYVRHHDQYCRCRSKAIHNTSK